MKKLLSLVCALLMLGTLAACGGNPGDAPNEPSEPSAVQPSEETPATPPVETGGKTVDHPKTHGDEGRRVLVAYFSATGNTGGVAQVIIDHLSADAYEIIPEEPYTAADLDYGDSSSRSSVEMDDPGTRPAISGSMENMEQYDVIFLGYPIW